MSGVNQVISFRGTVDLKDGPYGWSIYFGFNGGPGPLGSNHADFAEKLYEFITGLKLLLGPAPKLNLPAIPLVVGLRAGLCLDADRLEGNWLRSYAIQIWRQTFASSAR